MKTIIVDDEYAASNYLKHLCEAIDLVELVGVFNNPQEALDFLVKEKVDLAFLDIEMPELTGMDIARTLKVKEIKTEIVFVTGYEHYALEAFKQNAVSYLLKPSELEDVENAVKRAQKLLEPKNLKKVFIKTFGRFDVFVNHEPIYFTNAKAKELLALLVDFEGGTLSMDAIIDKLWEDRPYDEKVKQLYRKAVSYLHQLQKNYGLNLFVSHRGYCHVNRGSFECDYYNLLAGVREAIESYDGYYLFNYCWSEGTVVKIEKLLEKLEGTN